MANYTRLAATAKRLIDANGRTVTLTKQGVTAADPTKPWRTESVPVAESVTGAAVFVSTEPGKLGAQWRNPDNLKRGDQVVFFAANNDDGNELETYDTITDGDEEWKIVSTQLLAPADTRLLYMFEVRR